MQLLCRIKEMCMKDYKEQTKQKISIELENARLCLTLLNSLIVLFFAVALTTSYFSNSIVLRCIFGMFILATIIFLLILRLNYLSRARKHIETI